MRLDIHGNKNHFRDSIMPEGMDTQDIGSGENRWRSITVRDMTVSSLALGGFVTASSTPFNFTAVNGSVNATNMLVQPTASGTTQQIAFSSQIAATNVGGTSTGRLAGYFGAQTGGGTGAGTGNPIWGLNIIIQKNSADTNAQAIGIELNVNNNKADDPSNLSGTTLSYGFSANSNGANIAAIGFNLGGAGQWRRGMFMSQGSIASGGYALDYRGSGAANTTFNVSELGQLILGTAFVTGAGNGEIVMANGKFLLGNNQAAGAQVAMIGVNTSDQVVLNNGGGDIKWGRANVALGAGAPPTVGTIGGAGPAAAGQRNWLRFIESDGTASFIPVWR